MIGARGRSDLTPGTRDATRVISAAVVLPVRDVHTARISCTAPYRVTVSTDPILVTTDQASTVGMLTLSSDDLVQLPEDDTSHAFCDHSFEVADADGNALTVQPGACIAAAPELCDTVDNVADATSITGATVVLGSGESIEDYGSLHAEGDVDWWYFEVGEDGATSRTVSFTVTLTVPASDTGSPAGTWVLAAAVRTSAALLSSTRTTTELPHDCASIPGLYVLTWSIEGKEGVRGEYFWRVGLTSGDWEPTMCTDGSTPATYSIMVTK